MRTLSDRRNCVLEHAHVLALPLTPVRPTTVATRGAQRTTQCAYYTTYAWTCMLMHAYNARSCAQTKHAYAHTQSVLMHTYNARACAQIRTACAYVLEHNARACAYACTSNLRNAFGSRRQRKVQHALSLSSQYQQRPLLISPDC